MKKIIQVVVIMLTLALFIGACLPAASGQQNPQVQNTQSLQDAESQISTAVAQTIEAQNQIGTLVALTTEAQATATFTATPFTIPTLTPFVIPTSTTRPSTGGGGGGSTSPGKYEFSCDIINRRPFDNTEILHGQDFDIKWTIKNTGTKSWDSGMDMKYFSGPKMTSITLLEIPVVMEPNDTYDIVLDATAPQELGFQVMTWAVQGQLCYPYVALMVH